jgi:hypothetical protein
MDTETLTETLRTLLTDKELGIDTKTFSEALRALLTDKELAIRWKIKSPKTAVRRMKRFGVRPIKLTRRCILYRWSDVLRIEDQCQ